MSGENLWPGSPAGFREAKTAYYGAILSLARKLIRVFALALELPESYFDTMVSKPGALANGADLLVELSKVRAAHQTHLSVQALDARRAAERRT